MKKRFLHNILLTGLLMGLTACGFHLRGSYQVPDFLHEVTLRNSAADKDFEKEMRLALERSNILPEGGEVLLDITRENITRQTSTVDSSAKAAEYTLVYTVEYRVGTVDGKVYGDRQNLILRRSYQYSTTNVVGKSTEEETLVRELRVDAAQQIVRQLTAMKSLPVADKDAKKADAEKTEKAPATEAPAADSTPVKPAP
ncbi:MAG: LPS assembly lipoprotein LptE [Pedobacter sp.]|nr:LPS assembly lipoprotein LptE [Pedobacter sp.]